MTAQIIQFRPVLAATREAIAYADFQRAFAEWERRPNPETYRKRVDAYQFYLALVPEAV